MAGSLNDLFENSRKEPHFFEGQALGPDELNRLAAFATARASAPLGSLAPAGGILRHVRDELRVVPAGPEGLEVKVLPGAALSAGGYFYDLSEPAFLNLHSIAPLDPEAPARNVYVYLVARETLTDAAKDPEIPEIEGFRSKTLGFEIVAADRVLRDGHAVELCRLTLTSEVKRLQAAETNGAEATKAPGRIDLGYRRYVSLLCGRQLTVPERNELVRGIRRSRGILVHLSDAFNVALSNSVAPVCIGMEAELHRDNLEEGSLRGLLDEGLDAVASMLEEVRSLLGVQSDGERRGLVESTLNQIAELKGHPSDVIEDLRKMTALVDAVDRDLLGMNELKLKILHALGLIRHKAYVQSQTIAPAGRVFHLRDHVSAADAGPRLTTTSGKREKVSFAGRGAVGPNETMEALAVDGGELKVQPGHLTPAKDVLVLGRTYKRRCEVSVTYEWNGTVVHQERASEADPEHGVSLFGFIVPGSLVTSGDNHMRAKIESYELAYPFLGLSFYQ